MTSGISNTNQNDYVHPTNTEVIDLSGEGSVSLPNYPKRIHGTTGQFFDDKAIICGGYSMENGGEGVTNECFALSKAAASFENYTRMKENRIDARSLVTQDHIWVTGGGFRSKVTEYIPKSSTNNEPILPEVVNHHAIFSINKTSSMLIGGSTHDANWSNKTYYFNHESNTWKDGPSLTVGRNDHTAGLIKDHVTNNQHIVVVGGYIDSYYGDSSDSVEIMLNGETQWKKGILE